MTYEIRPNTQFGSLEIYFAEKPGEIIREALKGLKFRWNGKKACWYGFADPEEVKTVCEGKKTTKKAEKPADDQKRLRALFMEEITKYWKTPDMIKHCDKSTAYIVELTNGDIIGIDKPRIETRFCFGYGMYARSTDEEYRNAANMAEHAATSEDYFIQENLKGIEQTIKELKEAYKIYSFLHYYKQDKDSKLKDFSTARTVCYSPEYDTTNWSNYEQLTELTEEDRQRLIKGYEEVKTQFIKRLNTYLKRYGLSKVYTWTYLVD